MLNEFKESKKKFLRKMAAPEKKGKMKLILIIVANDLERVIGNGCQVDIKSVHEMFSRLAHAMKFNLLELIIKGQVYSEKNVLGVIKSITPGKNDIVVFYYTGHGFTFTKRPELKFPQIDLQTNPASNKQADILKSTQNLNNLYEKIKAKGARLTIVIGDCCNNRLTFKRKFFTEDLKMRSTKWPKVMNKEMGKMLFCYPRASILVAAADKGQLSISTNSLGGIFTFNLLNNIKKMLGTSGANSKTLNWDNLLQKTKLKTARLSKTFDIGNGKPGNQDPIFNIHSA
jgi:hypothetical protein